MDEPLFATHVPLDMTDQGLCADVSDRNLLHKRVMSLFGHSGSDAFRHEANILWRYDRLPNLSHSLFITSDTKPDASKISQPWARGASVIDYSAWLQRFGVGDSVRYVITANPTRVKTVNGRKTRQTVPDSQIDKWWANRAASTGLALDSTEVRVKPHEKVKRHSGTFNVSLVEIEGQATVTDVALLQQTLREGIGRAKAYGAGMLCIHPE